MIPKNTRCKIKTQSNLLRHNQIIVIEAPDTELWEGGWENQMGNPTCLVYSSRQELDKLPSDGTIYYGHLEDSNLGLLVHESELEVLH